MKSSSRIRLLIVSLTVAIALALGAARMQAMQGQRQGGVPNRVDVLNMERPIEIHESVWMADLTSLEARDLIKSGKTTALVMSGGVEENGPYMILDKHNIVAKIMGEAIARKLGNALVAPEIPIEPSLPNHGVTPGAPVVSDETFKALLMDYASSLKTMGFKNIVFLGDSTENLKPMEDAANTLNNKWKGEGAKVIFIEKYGNSGPDSGCCGHGTVIKYQEDVLGVHEKNDGFHANYHMSAIMMTADPVGNAIRLPERMKAHKTMTNGIDMSEKDKVIENGKKLIAYRTDITVKEIQKRIAMNSSN